MKQHGSPRIVPSSLLYSTPNRWAPAEEVVQGDYGEDSRGVEHPFADHYPYVGPTELDDEPENQPDEH